MGDDSGLHSPRSGPKGDFTLVIRRSTKVKFVILNAKGSKRRVYFGHSLFDQCKIRHFEFRAYIPRHIQRSTNVDVAHLVIRRSTKVNFVILSSEPTSLDTFNVRPT